MAQDRHHRDRHAAQVYWASSPRDQAQVSPDLVTALLAAGGGWAVAGQDGGRTQCASSNTALSEPAFHGRLQHPCSVTPRSPGPWLWVLRALCARSFLDVGLGRARPLHPVCLPACWKASPFPLAVPAKSRPLTGSRGCPLSPERSLVRGTGLSLARPESCALPRSWAQGQPPRGTSAKQPKTTGFLATWPSPTWAAHFIL